MIKKIIKFILPNYIKNLILIKIYNINESNFKKLVDDNKLYEGLNFSIQDELLWWEKSFRRSKKKFIIKINTSFF